MQIPVPDTRTGDAAFAQASVGGLIYGALKLHFRVSKREGESENRTKQERMEGKREESRRVLTTCCLEGYPPTLGHPLLRSPRTHSQPTAVQAREVCRRRRETTTTSAEGELLAASPAACTQARHAWYCSSHALPPVSAFSLSLFLASSFDARDARAREACDASCE